MLGRRRYAKPLPVPKGLSRYQYDLATMVAQQTNSVAIRVHQKLKSAHGDPADMNALNRAAEGLYGIAAKLSQVDAALPVDGELFKIIHVSQTGLSPAELQPYVDSQQEGLTKWAGTLPEGKKREWFESVIALRAKIAAALCESFAHIKTMEENLTFMQSARDLSGLLPEFSLADAADELESSAAAAEKSRQLAESVAEYALPELGPLESPGMPLPRQQEVIGEGLNLGS